MSRPLRVVPIVFLASGCMMAGGLGGWGMHGAGDGSMHAGAAPPMPAGQTVVREVVAHGLRVSAQFPAYAGGDSLLYTVTVVDMRTASPVTDAAVSFLWQLDNVATRPAAAARGHAGGAEPAGSGPVRSGGVSAEPAAGGTYLFRPPVTEAGAYTVSIAVTHVGTRALQPPIELTQRVDLARGQPAAGGHAAPGGNASNLTLLIAGALLMGMMMAFTAIR